MNDKFKISIFFEKYFILMYFQLIHNYYFGGFTALLNIHKCPIIHPKKRNENVNFDPLFRIIAYYLLIARPLAKLLLEFLSRSRTTSKDFQ